MKTNQMLFTLITAGVCASLIACGKTQDRLKISDRTGGKSEKQNSKLLNPESIVKTCAAESGKTEEAKKILSLSALQKSLTSSSAGDLFAASFTSRIQITDGNKNDLKNSQLSQTYLLQNGLQYYSAPLSSLAPNFLNVTLEDCNTVRMPIAGIEDQANLFFQLARLDVEELAAFSDSPKMLRAAEDSTEKSDDQETSGEATTAKEQNADDQNSVAFGIDRGASSEKMLVLIHPNGKQKILIKVVGDETIQIINEGPDQLVACGKQYSFQLRNEATLVWGKAYLEPVTLDKELYETMKGITDKVTLLNSGMQENSNGRRAKGSTIQSVSLPVAFIGSFDESIEKFRNKEPNDFQIQAVNCDGESESTPEDEATEATPEGENDTPEKDGAGGDDSKAESENDDAWDGEIIETLEDSSK